MTRDFAARNWAVPSVLVWKICRRRLSSASRDLAEGGNIERLPEGVFSLTAKRRAESALRSAEMCTEAGGAREKIQGVKWLVLFHSTTERERGDE